MAKIKIKTTSHIPDLYKIKKKKRTYQKITKEHIEIQKPCCDEKLKVPRVV